MSLLWLHAFLLASVFLGLYALKVLRNGIQLLSMAWRSDQQHGQEVGGESAHRPAVNEPSWIPFLQPLMMPGRTMPDYSDSLAWFSESRRRSGWGSAVAGTALAVCLLNHGSPDSLSTGTLGTADCFAGDWTSFQNGGGAVETLSTTKFNWEADPQLVWQAEIPGYGQSSPVLLGNRIYLTTVEGANKETYRVLALDRNSGQQIWDFSRENPSPRESSNYVSKAAPTPIADPQGVISFFEGGLLVALSPEGKTRWQRNLQQEFGPLDERHGLSASLEQDAESLYVWVERGAEPYVLKLDKQTGKTLWNVPGLGTTSWASPRLVPVEGSSQLVLSGIGKLRGLDLATGETLWEFTELAGNSTPTPMPTGPGQFLLGATVGREGGDAGRAVESNGLLQISRSDAGDWACSYVWQAKRATSSFGSPAASSDTAYFVNRSGVLYALDLKTGEELYAERIGDSIWATPIVLRDAVLFLGKGGTLDVLAPGAEFKPLKSFAVWESTQGDTPPVLYAGLLSDNHLLLRAGSRLACFELPTLSR